jgi:hypothetical protein
MILKIVDSPDDPEPVTIRIDLAANDDRSGAMVAAALLAGCLEDEIKRNLVEHEALFNSFFKGTGPLTPFGTKIDMAVLLGILADSSAAPLHTIRKIRNDFAHSARPMDFDSQRIGALCRNLRRATKCQIGDTTISVNASDDTPRTHYLAAIMLYVVALLLRGHVEAEAALPPSPGTPE